jgi:cell division protein FtsQ
MPRPGPTFEHRPSRPLRGQVLLDDETRRRIGRARIRRLGIVCAFVGLIGATVAVYFSPIVRVHDVKVEGASEATTAEIEGIVDLDGESMLTVSFSEAHRQIAGIPSVKAVRFEREWPQTVKVVVTERAPWGVWMLGETPYVIDDEGVVLSGVAAPDGAPVIRVPASDGILGAGDRVDYDAVALTREMLINVPAKLGLNIAIIEWTSASGLKLTTDAGYRVIIGDSENWDYKLAVWQELEEQIGREEMNGQILDLRFGDRPAIAAIATPTPVPTNAPSATPSEVSQ